MNTIKFSELKALRDIVGDEWREITEVIRPVNGAMYNDSGWDGDYRVIAASAIDEIMQDELSDDEYILGCFNDWFLASVLDIDVEVIEAMQKAEAFEAIGKLVISMDKLQELQAEYAGADGYGHHFSHYDGSEEEITLGGENYYVFRIN
jgi:hypothetical protein